MSHAATKLPPSLGGYIDKDLGGNETIHIPENVKLKNRVDIELMPDLDSHRIPVKGVRRRARDRWAVCRSLSCIVTLNSGRRIPVGQVVKLGSA